VNFLRRSVGVYEVHATRHSLGELGVLGIKFVEILARYASVTGLVAFRDVIKS
jgi:hypothetical protein